MVSVQVRRAVSREAEGVEPVRSSHNEGRGGAQWFDVHWGAHRVRFAQDAGSRVKWECKTRDKTAREGSIGLRFQDQVWFGLKSAEVALSEKQACRKAASDHGGLLPL